MRVILALLAFAVAAPGQGASLSEAQSLYDRNKLAEAERAFAAIAADRNATTADRSAAERQLARIAWLIEADAQRALRHLGRAERIGDKPCETAILLARILNEAQMDEEALRRGPALLAGCDELDKRELIRTHLVESRLDLAVESAAPQRLLADAFAEGERLTGEAGVDGARVRLEAALLAGRAEEALAAWKDYFWLEEDDAPQALASIGATATFRDGLAVKATTAAKLRLADLLMRAGFARASQRYAEISGLSGAVADDPTWRRLTAYWAERRRVEDAVLRVNRGLARGKTDETTLEQVSRAATGTLMTAAGASGDPRAALRQHYGLVGTVGKTSGYPSIHMGHVIEDRDDEVSQYGRSAKIHFIVIDSMIANGFESWLWDGSAMVGGWTADGVIVHIRPGYVRSPMRAFRLTQDSADRRELIARQARRAAEDVAKLKARPVATLEGLNDRLQLQLVDQIWAAARSRASTEEDVRRLFLAEYDRASLHQSITVHEGRHAIDNSLGLTDQPVLEYQAKLAELALTAYPRMALRNMNRNLEGEGPHDRAGARVFDEFRKWMEAHTAQIVGYDLAVPVLAQLDKLTDGQIREIARSLDPLAPKP